MDRFDLTTVVSTGDRKAVLETLRDRLASDIDMAHEPRDVAVLSARLLDVLEALAKVPGDRKDTPLNELARRRASAAS